MLKSHLNLSLAAVFCLAGATPMFGQEPTPLLTQPEGQLIAVLKSDAPQKAKADACRELAVVGTRAAVPALAALLGDENLAHMARYGLEPIPDPSVDAALREALGKLKGRLRLGVIGSLGVRRDAKAIQPLARLLNDADADAARAAALALGRIGTAAAGKPMLAALPKAAPACQLAFCEGLLRCAEALTTAGDRKQALVIYDKLRTTPGLPQQVRAGATRGAILVPGNGGLALLQQSLASKDYIVFAAAIRAALEMTGTGATPALVAALPQLPQDRQVVLLSALGRRGDVAALRALSDAAVSGSQATRIAGIRAITELAKPAVIPVLVGLSGDNDREVAQVAQDGLASIAGAEADSAVMEMLTSADANRRLAAIEMIGGRRMASAIPALLKAAGDPDAKVRPAALKRLGELAGPSEQPRLLATLLQAQDPADLDAAEQALSAVCVRAGDSEACAAKLTGALADGGIAQRCALFRVLSTIGGKTAWKTIRSAVDYEPTVVARTAALRALCDWRTADAGPELLALAQSASNPSDKSLCLRGALRLAADTDLPANDRLALCRQAASLVQQPDEKKLLLGALGGIKTAPALALVTPYLDDASVKEEAGAAVVAIAGPLLKAADAAALAPGLVDPLRRAAQLTGNADLARRARALLQQAQTQGGGR